MPTGQMIKPGKSILEMLWDRLLEADDRLAPGLAEAIAIMTNPYSPNLDEVRRQYLERQG